MATFERLELKYLITTEQRRKLETLFREYMRPDVHGKSTICNLYYDTPDFRLIRRSVEKPNYKEKMRIRSYGISKPEKDVYVELKKKFDHVVYKRRITMKEHETVSAFEHPDQMEKWGQIGKEISYFFKQYPNLGPRVYISYDRTAYFGRDNDNLRITFDENILFRMTDLSLCSNVYGREILEPGTSLMEIKCADAMPLWLVHFLSEQEIRRISFSKVGRAYQITLQDRLDAYRKGLNKKYA